MLATFKSPASFETITDSVPDYLYNACILANEANKSVVGYPDNCISTSMALSYYLRDYAAEPTRVTAAVFPGEGHGVTLGSDGCGERLPKASPGMWHGHLAVLCQGYLLDPTLDQVKLDSGKKLTPISFPVTDDWLDGVRPGGTVFMMTSDGVMVRYNKFHRQVGWKSTPAARKYQWMHIYEEMTERTS